MGVRLSPAYQDPYPKKTNILTFPNTIQSLIALYLLSSCLNHSGSVIFGSWHFVTASVSSYVQWPIMSESTFSQQSSDTSSCLAFQACSGSPLRFWGSHSKHPYSLSLLSNPCIFSAILFPLPRHSAFIS